MTDQSRNGLWVIPFELDDILVALLLGELLLVMFRAEHAVW